MPESNHKEFTCHPLVEVVLSDFVGNQVFQVIKQTLFPQWVIDALIELRPFVHSINIDLNGVYMCHSLFSDEMEWWWSFAKVIHIGKGFTFQDDDASSSQYTNYEPYQLNQLKKDFLTSLHGCDCSICLSGYH